MADEVRKKSTSVVNARDAAQIALLDAITQGVADVTGREGFTVADQSGTIRNLALALRLTIGGPQPGGVDISK